jgi:hypothetical protein
LPFGTAQYIGRLGSSKFATFFLFQWLNDDELPKDLPRLHISLDLAALPFCCSIH